MLLRLPLLLLLLLLPLLLLCCMVVLAISCLRARAARLSPAMLRAGTCPDGEAATPPKLRGRCGLFNTARSRSPMEVCSHPVDMLDDPTPSTSSSSCPSSLSTCKRPVPNPYASGVFGTRRYMFVAQQPPVDNAANPGPRVPQAMPISAAGPDSAVSAVASCRRRLFMKQTPPPAYTIALPITVAEQQPENARRWEVVRLARILYRCHFAKTDRRAHTRIPRRWPKGNGLLC